MVAQGKECRAEWSAKWDIVSHTYNATRRKTTKGGEEFCLLAYNAV
jgi:hypothetical protein